MTRFLPILADDSDLGKVVIGVFIAIVWGISALVTNYKKASAKERQKSWQDILKSLPNNQQNQSRPTQQSMPRPQMSPITPTVTARSQPPRIPPIPAKNVQPRRQQQPRRKVVPNSSEIAARVSQLNNPQAPRRPMVSQPPVASNTFKNFQAAASAHQVAGGGSHLAGGGGARIEMAGSSTQIAGGQTSQNRNAPVSDALLLLRNPSSIRSEFILAEILRTPVALREDH